VIRSVVDPGKAGRELGWQAKTSLAEGLGATWGWLQSRP
jgi:nucleoside-diphosphate-sugar epimerase